MVDEKAKKACIKEGGKKGIDLSGVSALGGVSFFNVAVETANGDLELLQYVMEGANAEVDESAEERKGGAGDIAKMFLSAGEDQLAIYAHVPKALAAEKNVTLKEWLAPILKACDGEVVEESEEFAKAVAKKDADAGKFPLKMRDDAISAGFAFLREKGLVLDDDSDDDVNYAEAAGVEW